MNVWFIQDIHIYIIIISKTLIIFKVNPKANKKKKYIQIQNKINEDEANESFEFFNLFYILHFMFKNKFLIFSFTHRSHSKKKKK
jgi:hypothetical protein